MQEVRPKTLFIDIDGVLLRHYGQGNAQATSVPEILPGVLSKLDEWDRKGYRIILVTGRRESERESTITQLYMAGIVYDHLIMGLGGGQRVLINDLKTYSTEPTAVAICVDRNEGLSNVDI